MPQSTPNELKRLAQNHHALLNVMQEMVLLACSSGSIEYMNPCCSLFFEHLESTYGQDRLQKQVNNLIQEFLRNKKRGKQHIVPFHNLFFECRMAPFKGYNGDKLYWLVLKKIIDEKEKQNQLYIDESDKSQIIGSSTVMQNLNAIVSRVATTDTTVLIMGESGTGKELVANLLKNSSKRKHKPFLTINCNTISDLLLESELFGYEQGSFTGADKQRKGKFEIVNRGTIFLDEIGDISPRMQAALLRVLQNGEITRVGGHTPIKIDVRIIAATNKDLTAAVQKGTFRLDLYYRLNVINIIMPPLRDKKEDINDLATYFINKYNSIFGKSINLNLQYISEKLKQYHWPGNVRELENVMHRAVLMCRGDTLKNDDITFDMPTSQIIRTSTSLLDSEQIKKIPLKNIVSKVEKEVIINQLKSSHGNVAKAAESLEISKAAIYDKMKRYGILTKTL